MIRVVTIATLVGMVTCACVAANEPTSQPSSMVITRSGAQPSNKGAEQYFRRAVRVDPLFAAKEPSRISVGSVTLELGARSAWHTHPLGQILIVTDSAGWVDWMEKVSDMQYGK